MTDKNYLVQDGHPAILLLRIAAIVSAFTTLVVFAWAIKAHDRVYTDIDGASLCAMILATVSERSHFSNAISTESNILPSRHHMQSFGLLYP